jgi:putative nucleotidyltransferase with HDIG domain
MATNPIQSDELSPQYQLILRRVKDMPSLPDVVHRIIQLLGDSQVPASQIAKLVSYDPGLTTKVLRMVNSAAYGFQRQISSVQHALMLLGFNTVRGLVLSASLFQLFDPNQTQSIDPKLFWRHSLATAIIAKTLAEKLHPELSDDAFSAGILHDIGKVIFDQYFTEDYPQVTMFCQHHKLRLSGAHFYRVEREILGLDHGQLGGLLAKKWKLPAALHACIVYHHEPHLAEHSQALVYLVALANDLSHVMLDNMGVFDSQWFHPEVLARFAPDETGWLELLKWRDIIQAPLEGVEELAAFFE